VLAELKRLCAMDFPEVLWQINEDGTFKLK